MPTFATYLHPHTCYTSKPIEQIEFLKNSYPNYSQQRIELAKLFTDYPALPVYQAEYTAFATVHKVEYLESLQAMAIGQPIAKPLQLSMECILSKA
ncbi:hypothetical protein TI05_19580, partial [Achromatium sp. WMS3]